MKPAVFSLTRVRLGKSAIRLLGLGLFLGLGISTAQAQSLSPGRYILKNVNSQKCAGVAGSSTADGGNIEQQTCSGALSEAFDVSVVAGGYYKFINVNSGKAMDVAGFSNLDGGNVQQWADSNNNAQRYSVSASSAFSGAYTIANVNSGKCVDVAGASSMDGANIQQYGCNDTAAQAFLIVPPPSGLAPGRYALRNTNSQRCVGIQGASTANGALAQQQTCNGGSAQAFDVSVVSGGAYKFINVNSGKALDITNFSNQDNAPVQQWADSGNNAQSYTVNVSSTVSGAYTIANVNSTKCVNVAGASTADGAGIQQYTCNNTGGQSFVFVPQVTAIAPGRYALKNTDSQRCVGIHGASFENGGLVQQQTCTGGPSQVFDISAVSPGVYKFINLNSVKALDITNFSNQDGAPVQQWADSNNEAQRFRVQVSANGYAFVNVNSGKCLAVQSSGSAQGAPLQQFTCSGTGAQSFTLVAQTFSNLPALPPYVAPVVNYEYDAQGNPTKTVQAPGVTNFNFERKAYYDALARVKESRDTLDKSTLYEYDGVDRLTKVTDPLALQTSSPRNGLGDVTSLTSPDTGVATHTYDEAGNLKTRTDSRNVLATYTYDALNRLTGIVYTKAGQATQTYTWGYDLTGTGFGAGVGRLGQTSHPSGSTQYEYDSWGEVVTDSQRINAVSGGNAANVVLNTLYTYDSSGRITSMTYPSGRKLAVTFQDGQASILGVAKDASSTPVPLISQIQWEPFGSAVRSWQWQMASGQVPHERVFDTAGRMVRYPMGAVARDVTYDPAGRITAYTHHDIANGSAQTDWDQSFSYDAMGRIKGVTLNGGTSSWSYGYDDNGNRKTMTLGSSVTNYTLEANSNRVSTATNPARTWTYADGAGNTTADTGGVSPSYSATYDLAGRLATLTRSGVTTTYSYDGLGRRVRKVSSTGAASTVLFAYDQQGQLIGEYSNTGAAIREYVWLGSTPIAILTPDPAAPTGEPIAYLIHADHLDTPRVVIDKNNARRWRWMQAEPFGTSAPETNPEGLGAFTQNLRFPGQYADQESGLSYNYFRNYDPSKGGYTQSDPIGRAGGINTYAYVGADPLRFFDPLGLYTEIIVWSGVGKGESQFGHVSTNLNGQSYSWGPGGWDKQYSSAADYAARQQQFRDGQGYVLNLTPKEEAEFKKCLDAHGGRYSFLKNNCGTPPQECLPPRLRLPGGTWSPQGLGNDLSNSPGLIDNKTYPGPERSGAPFNNPGLWGY